MLLGGEVSLWTDDYVFPAECGAFAGRVPANGSSFYSRQYDAAFAKSIGGMLWPRGFVAAGAFYRYAKGLDIKSTAFVSRMTALTQLMQARGGDVCGAGCRCDYCAQQCGAGGVPQVYGPASQRSNPGNCSRA
jgi:hypothetical protein